MCRKKPETQSGAASLTNGRRQGRMRGVKLQEVKRSTFRWERLAGKEGREIIIRPLGGWGFGRAPRRGPRSLGVAVRRWKRIQAEDSRGDASASMRVILASRAGLRCTGAITRPVLLEVQFPTCSGDHPGACGRSCRRRGYQQTHVALMNQQPDGLRRARVGVHALDHFARHPVPGVHAQETKGEVFHLGRRERGQTPIILVMAEVHRIMNEDAEVLLSLSAQIRFRPESFQAVGSQPVHSDLQGRRSRLHL